MTIVKPKNHDTILVRIEKPETNVDWESYVDSQPVWGKKLEATLSTGATEITYRARSPYNSMFDMCRVIINVIGTCSAVSCCCSIDETANRHIFLSLLSSFRANSAERKVLPRAIHRAIESTRGDETDSLEGAHVREQTTHQACVQV
jgi:hypothetical protein